jgi:hypothetical protein
MTYQNLERDCDDRAHRGLGAWDDYVRVLHVRRQKCSQPERTDFETFRELVDLWRTETWHQSSTNRRVSHPAYLKIIGLGKQSIPWILQELRQQPDYWFAALEAISRDPSPNTSANATDISSLRDAWLEWGKAHGY